MNMIKCGVILMILKSITGPVARMITKSWVNRPFKAETVLFLWRTGVNNERILLSAG